MMKFSFTIQKKIKSSEDLKQWPDFAGCDKSYGENCQYPCSPLCINQTCDPFNGTCLTRNCTDKSYGDKCFAGTLNLSTQHWLMAYCHQLKKKIQFEGVTVLIVCNLCPSLGDFNVIVFYCNTEVLKKLTKYYLEKQ